MGLKKYCSVCVSNKKQIVLRIEFDLNQMHD